MWIILALVVVAVIIYIKRNSIFKRNTANANIKSTISKSKPTPIPITHSDCRFNTTKMRGINGLFLIENNDIDVACDDILSLNFLLEQLHLNRKITKSMLRFGDFSQISTHAHVITLPLTSTGKLAKYPQKLNFFTTDSGWNVKNDLFGSIFYLSDGSIGKADITVWTKDICTTINATIINGTLKLNKAYRTDSAGNKTQIFKALK